MLWKKVPVKIGKTQKSEQKQFKRFIPFKQVSHSPSNRSIRSDNSQIVSIHSSKRSRSFVSQKKQKSSLKGSNLTMQYLTPSYLPQNSFIVKNNNKHLKHSSSTGNFICCQNMHLPQMRNQKYLINQIARLKKQLQKQKEQNKKNKKMIQIIKKQYDNMKITIIDNINSTFKQCCSIVSGMSKIFIQNILQISSYSSTSSPPTQIPKIPQIRIPQHQSSIKNILSAISNIKQIILTKRCSMKEILLNQIKIGEEITFRKLISPRQNQQLFNDKL